MGTRGVIGVVIDGDEKITYNHYDSYPSGLGLTTLSWLRSLTGSKLAEAADQARACRLVDEAAKPSADEAAIFAQFTDGNVSRGDDWYATLRHLQGDLGATLAAGVMLDSHGFVTDSLFCEWGYVVDFDRAVFEVYQGFQTAPHGDGRFADRAAGGSGLDSTYYPIRLVASWSLERLPSDDELLAIERADEEDEVPA